MTIWEARKAAAKCCTVPTSNGEQYHIRSCVFLVMKQIPLQGMEYDHAVVDNGGTVPTEHERRHT